MSATQASPVLDNLEWSAVAIALQDAHRCGCASASPRPRGWFGRLVRKVFGSQQPNGLADPRLEAVRRFVCETRRTRQPATGLVPALGAHGFSGAQIDALALLSI